MMIAVIFMFCLKIDLKSINDRVVVLVFKSKNRIKFLAASVAYNCQVVCVYLKMLPTIGICLLYLLLKYISLLCCFYVNVHVNQDYK